MTLKITLISKRPYSIEGKDGKTYTGFSYAGFASNGKPYSFSSQEEHEIHEDAGEFDPNLSEEIVLRPKITLEGKVKYREAAAEVAEF